jgi:hypothetical protein
MEVIVTSLGKLVGRALGLSLAAMLMVATWAPGAAAQISFKEDVFPIIELRCLECHQPGGAGYEKSGFDLRTYEGLMKGTRYGSMVTPRSPFESNLMAVIDHRTSSEIWMPHKRKQLTKCERQIFRAWVAQGARDN